MKAIFKETNEIVEVEPIFDRYSGEFICYQSGDFTKGDVKSYSKFELDFDTERKNFDPSEFVRRGQLIMTETIDWEERRFLIAKDLYCHNECIDVGQCVRYADNLIEALKEIPMNKSN